ncbi:hypothetical protein [Fibrobacter sp.]
MYRPTAECRDITEAFVFGYIDFMHARKNSAGCIYRSTTQIMGKNYGTY